MDATFPARDYGEMTAAGSGVLDAGGGISAMGHDRQRVGPRDVDARRAWR
jgi:hypothetical protein